WAPQSPATASPAANHRTQRQRGMATPFARTPVILRSGAAGKLSKIVRVEGAWHPTGEENSPRGPSGPTQAGWSVMAVGRGSAAVRPPVSGVNPSPAPASPGPATGLSRTTSEYRH